MLHPETVTIAKMQEPPMAEKDGSQTHVVPVQESPTSLSFVAQEPEHYLPDMSKVPAICCRLAEPHEIGEASFYVRYLAEGAANIIFTIHKWTGAPATPRKPFVFVDSNDRYSKVYNRFPAMDKVLRISKGHEKTGSSQEIIDGFDKNISPLFKASSSTVALSEENPYTMDLDEHPEDYSHYLMEYRPVLLTEGVIVELTSEIDEHSVRKENLSIPIQEQTGILLPNMSSQPGQSVTIEIKPKWLEQSPTAPKDSYRCRTCALECSRPAKDKKAVYICPLQLLTGNVPLIRPYVHRKVEKAISHFGNAQPTPSEIDAIVDRITRYLATGKGHQLLQHLKRTQIKLDPGGFKSISDARKEAMRSKKDEDVEKVDNMTANVMLAMTMRDCSMYIKVNYLDLANTSVAIQNSSPPSPEVDRGIECKLGDLDSKDEKKFDDWAAKEEKLINGGYYVWPKHGGEVDHEHERCMLSAGWEKHCPHWF